MSFHLGFHGLGHHHPEMTRLLAEAKEGELNMHRSAVERLRGEEPPSDGGLFAAAWRRLRQLFRG